APESKHGMLLTQRRRVGGATAADVVGRLAPGRQQEEVEAAEGFLPAQRMTRDRYRAMVPFDDDPVVAGRHRGAQLGKGLAQEVLEHRVHAYPAQAMPG